MCRSPGSFPLVLPIYIARADEANPWSSECRTRSLQSRIRRSCVAARRLCAACFAASVGFCAAWYDNSISLGISRVVRVLSRPFQNPGFPRVFRISGQFLWLSLPPMLARCMASCGVVFRIAHRKSSRFSSRAGSPNHWGFVSPPNDHFQTSRRGRIRTR